MVPPRRDVPAHTFDSFENRWFGYQRAQDAVNAHKTRIKRIAFPHAQKEIIDLVKDVSLAFNPKDWFDIKDPIVVPVYVELPPDARKRYREMEKDLFTTIGGHDIEAFAASAKMIKCVHIGYGTACALNQTNNWAQSSVDNARPRE